jgi:hypothetical protein
VKDKALARAHHVAVKVSVTTSSDAAEGISEDCLSGVLIAGGVSGSEWLEDLLLVQMQCDSGNLPGQVNATCLPVIQTLGMTYRTEECSGTAAGLAAGSLQGTVLGGGVVPLAAWKDRGGMVVGESAGLKGSACADTGTSFEAGVALQGGKHMEHVRDDRREAVLHPLARRDYAGCAIGMQQLIILGGFDGSQELFDLHLCSIALDRGAAEDAGHRLRGPAAPAATISQTQSCSRVQGSLEHMEPGAPSCVSSATVAGAACDTKQQGKGTPPGNTYRSSSSRGVADGATTESQAKSGGTVCRAVWEQLQPSNVVRPVGRSHHTVCYHPGSSSLLVFGGYSSRLGCLNEVWQFSMVHREWWQPEIKGRTHVGAVPYRFLCLSWMQGGC